MVHSFAARPRRSFARLFYHGLWVVLEEHPIMFTDSPVNSVRLGTHDGQYDGFLHTEPTNVSEAVEVTTCSTTCTSLLPRAADFGKRGRRQHFARELNTIGKDIVDLILVRTKKLVNDYTGLQDFLIYNTCGGGTRLCREAVQLCHVRAFLA